MTILSLPELTIDSSGRVKLNPESDPVSPSTNSFQSDFSYSLLLITDGPLHIGGVDVVADRTVASLMPAGSYPMELDDGEDIYAIAPPGTTVVVKRIAQGLRTTSPSPGGGGGSSSGGSSSGWGGAWGG